MKQPRREVTLENIVAYPHGGVVRLSDLKRITGFGHATIRRDIDCGRLVAYQNVAGRGCWFVARQDAIDWLMEKRILHAEAC